MVVGSLPTTCSGRRSADVADACPHLGKLPRFTGWQPVLPRGSQSRRLDHCAHSSKAAGSPRRWARISPAKCSEPVARIGFGFARARSIASLTDRVTEIVGHPESFRGCRQAKRLAYKAVEEFALTFPGQLRAHCGFWGAAPSQQSERALRIFRENLYRKEPPGSASPFDRQKLGARFLPELRAAPGLCAPSMMMRSSHF